MNLEKKEEFIAEIDEQIKNKRKLESRYKYTQLWLMMIITACGFLTSVSVNEGLKNLWISRPNSVLVFGLLSALCAIMNQVLTPSEKLIFHKQVRKALTNIRGAVKYGNMSISDAEKLRAQAIIDPAAVLSQSHHLADKDMKSNKSNE